MKQNECEWYNPVNGRSNDKRKQTYYVAHITSAGSTKLTDMEYDDFRKCIDYVPVGTNDCYIIRKNDDYTETVIFIWNKKHKLWFNVCDYSRTIV